MDRSGGSGGTHIPLNLDTGAGADLLNIKDYNRLQRKPKLRESPVNLEDYNDNTIKAVGTCTTMCKVRGREYLVNFIVVEKCQSLLGHKSIDRLKLVKCIHHIEAEIKGKVMVKDVFQCTLPEGEELSSLPYKHIIHLKDNAVPITHTARRVPLAIGKALRKVLGRMEDLKVLQEVNELTEWDNEMVIVLKSNGFLRILADMPMIDYRVDCAQCLRCSTRRRSKCLKE